MMYAIYYHEPRRMKEYYYEGPHAESFEYFMCAKDFESAIKAIKKIRSKSYLRRYSFHIKPIS